MLRSAVDRPVVYANTRGDETSHMRPGARVAIFCGPVSGTVATSGGTLVNRDGFGVAMLAAKCYGFVRIALSRSRFGVPTCPRKRGHGTRQARAPGKLIQAEQQFSKPVVSSIDRCGLLRIAPLSPSGVGCVRPTATAG